MRPVPQLRVHSRLGLAYVAFKLYGVRRWVYFGKAGTRAAGAKYAKFRREWPDVLFNPTPPKGTWPAVRLITHAGRTQSLARWAREYGLRPGTLKHRLDVLGWPVGRALETPGPGVTFRGRTQSLARWAAELGIGRATLKYRLQVARWPVERAFTTPPQARRAG